MKMLRIVAGGSQGVQKVFRAPMYRAHIARSSLRYHSFLVNYSFISVFSGELQKKACIKSNTLPQICSHTTLRKLNVQLTCKRATLQYVIQCECDALIYRISTMC